MEWTWHTSRSIAVVRPFAFGGGVFDSPDARPEPTFRAVQRASSWVVGDGWGEAVGHHGSYVPATEVVEEAVDHCAQHLANVSPDPLPSLLHALGSRFADRKTAATVDLGILDRTPTGIRWRAVGAWMLLVKHLGRVKIAHPGDTLAHRRHQSDLPCELVHRDLTLSRFCVGPSEGPMDVGPEAWPIDQHHPVDSGDAAILLNQGTWSSLDDATLIAILSSAAGPEEAFELLVEAIGASGKHPHRTPVLAWLTVG